MANVALNTDPLDELRLLAPAVPDRLPAMLFLAALVHGILIIGVTFNVDLTDQFSNTISLEVTIVADADQQIDRPDDAEYLAQASVEGGGNTTEQVRPSAPLQSAMPVDNEGIEEGTTLIDAKSHERSADEVLASQDTSDRQVEIDPRTDPQSDDSIAIVMEAGSEVTLPLPRDDDASFLIRDNEPRQLIISADTRESVALRTSTTGSAVLRPWEHRTCRNSATLTTLQVARRSWSASILPARWPRPSFASPAVRRFSIWPHWRSCVEHHPSTHSRRKFRPSTIRFDSSTNGCSPNR